MEVMAADMQHPNVVHIHEIIDDSMEYNKIVVAMEHCPGGQILKWNPSTKMFTPDPTKVDENGQIPEETIKRILWQVAQGLHFLHAHGVIHRDIKPQNIMFGEAGQAKIIDFGVATVLSDPKGDDLVKQTEGTYHFMAPEACDPDLDELKGKPMDVWALGVTLYTLLYLKVPFDGITDHLIMEAIRQQPFEVPKERQVSPELMEILLGLCEKDPEKRMKLD